MGSYQKKAFDLWFFQVFHFDPSIHVANEEKHIPSNGQWSGDQNLGFSIFAGMNMQKSYASFFGEQKGT